MITGISEVSGSTGGTLGDSGSTTSTGRGVGGIFATNAGDVACFGEMRFKISAGMRLLKYKYPPEPARTRTRNKKIFPVPDFFFSSRGKTSCSSSWGSDSDNSSSRFSGRGSSSVSGKFSSLSKEFGSSSFSGSVFSCIKDAPPGTSMTLDSLTREANGSAVALASPPHCHRPLAG